MRKLLPVAIAYCICAPAYGDATDHKPSKLEGHYQIYSGSLGDMDNPSPKDTKLSIGIYGSAANEIFKAMGKKALAKVQCSPDSEERISGNLLCSRDKANARTICYLGYDVSRAKSIPGGIC